MPLQGLLPLTDRCDLLLKIRHGSRSAAGIIRINLVHLVKVAVESVVDTLQVRLQLGPREVAVPVVHRLDARAVHGDQLPPVQVEFPAQPHELPKHRPERMPIVAPEVGDRLEVGLQLA